MKEETGLTSARPNLVKLASVSLFSVKLMPCNFLVQFRISLKEKLSNSTCAFAAVTEICKPVKA